MRFDREGTIDRRIFTYRPTAEADAPNNPVLVSGDIIRVNDSVLSEGITVLNELTGPFVTVCIRFTLWSLGLGNDKKFYYPDQPHTPSIIQTNRSRPETGLSTLMRGKALITKITLLLFY